MTVSYVPQGATIDASYEANGVTDTSLAYKLGQAEDSVSDTLKFLDTLTPEQLQEKTVGEFQSGQRVTTYADLKTYDELLNGLDNVAGSLGSTMTTSADNVTSSTVTADDAKYMQAIGVKTDLNSNKAGSISEAETYLLGLSNASLASSAFGVASTSSVTKSLSSTTLSDQDIKEIFVQYQAKSSAWTADRMGGWSDASNARLMGQEESSELSEIADRIYKET